MMELMQPGVQIHPAVQMQPAVLLVQQKGLISVLREET